MICVTSATWNRVTLVKITNSVASDQLGDIQNIECLALLEGVIQAAGKAKELGKCIGSGKGDDHQPHKTCIQNTDGK